MGKREIKVGQVRLETGSRRAGVRTAHACAPARSPVRAAAAAAASATGRPEKVALLQVEDDQGEKVAADNRIIGPAEQQHQSGASFSSVRRAHHQRPVFVQTRKSLPLSLSTRLIGSEQPTNR